METIYMYIARNKSLLANIAGKPALITEALIYCMFEFHNA
jgi:hypothetical protein